MMQPEQLRAARAVLNWSHERLAGASRVHRNTLSNFETRKCDGEARKLASVKRALEQAGVIFLDPNGQHEGIMLRRFQVGDIVRFRPQTTARFSQKIGPDDTGTVVEVEPHPPRSGSTYKIKVDFAGARAPFLFRYEYELVKPAPGTDVTNYIVNLEERWVFHQPTGANFRIGDGEALELIIESLIHPARREAVIAGAHQALIKARNSSAAHRRLAKPI